MPSFSLQNHRAGREQGAGMTCMHYRTYLWVLCATIALPAGTFAADEPALVVGPGERVIMAPPRAKSEWRDSDLALRRAMDTDSTFTSKTGIALTQDGAIAGWKRLLERDDLSNHQRAFAWRRLGALYSYNFDPARGEKAAYAESEQALRKARSLLSNLVTNESLNSATVYATLTGKPSDKARRLSEVFHWLAARTDEEVD